MTVGDISSDLIFNSNTTLARSYDGTTHLALPGSWDALEVHYKIAQVSANGLQFRVGNVRQGIDTAIQWSVWAAYDGSFDPLAYIRFAFGNTVPLWFKCYAQYNLAISDEDILKVVNACYTAPPETANLALFQDDEEIIFQDGESMEW